MNRLFVGAFITTSVVAWCSDSNMVSNPLNICPCTDMLITGRSSQTCMAPPDESGDWPACCALFVNNPTIRLGMSWGTLPKAGQEQWTQRGCDRFKAGLTRARADRKSGGAAAAAACAVADADATAHQGLHGCHPSTDVRQSDMTADPSDTTGAFLQDGFFLLNGTFAAVLNTRELLFFRRGERRDRYRRYAEARWRCVFGDDRSPGRDTTNMVAAHVVGVDPEQYTLIVSCEPPAAERARAMPRADGKPSAGARVLLEAAWDGVLPTHPTESFALTVCPARSAGADAANNGDSGGGGGAAPSIDSLRGNTLVACTMERSVSDGGRIGEWVSHHLNVGFEHFIVYVNGPVTRAAPELQVLVSLSKRPCYAVSS